jgi:VanZ family protein
MRRSAWLAPIVWMCLILWLGSDSGSSEQTSRLILPLLRFLFPGTSPLQIDAMHAFIRKLGHVSEYAVLAGLWLRAFDSGPEPSRGRGAWRAGAIAVGWAVIDESLQSMVASRTGSPYDVALDGLGALVPILFFGEAWRQRVDTATRIALWIAVVGGSVMIIVNVTTHVGSGLLWLTVPAAGFALFALRRARP